MPNGTSTMGRCLSGPPCLTPGFGRWTMPWPRLSQRAVVSHMATSRAPRECCASRNVTRPRHCHRVEPGCGHHCIGSRVWLPRACQRPILGVSAGLLRAERAVLGLDHAPTEVVPTRQCAEISKIMYHTRTNGVVLDHAFLVFFVGHIRSALSASLLRRRP